MVRRNFQAAIAKLLVADPSHAYGHGRTARNHSTRESVAGPLSTVDAAHASTKVVGSRRS
eukprot:3238872-Prymnesium_polylepis.1